MNAGVLPSWRRDDSRLRGYALAFSLIVNLLAWCFIGFSIGTQPSAAPSVPQVEEAADESAVLWIEPAPAEAPPKRFVRTSAEVPEAAATDPRFIGERATRAASSRAPVVGAPPLPSQSGVQPRDTSDIETTESQYRDGPLDDQEQAANTPLDERLGDARAADPSSAPATDARAADHGTAGAPPKQTSSLPGSETIDVPTARNDTGPTADAPDTTTTGESATPPATPPASSPATTPAFRGNQRRTALVGSISRGGQSALDVEDTALGRYQAAIGRAVEREWQRNCARHRDFITPGFLTVRFFVGTDGRVRSVQFVGDMETGEVQKGFTLHSIRNAGIPPMPAALRREQGNEPLELVFRFYF